MFIEMAPQQIQFPPADLNEQSRGIFKTMAEGALLLKLAVSPLPGANPLLMGMVERMIRRLSHSKRSRARRARKLRVQQSSQAKRQS